METLKRLLVALLLLTVALFALQNMAMTDIEFLVWHRTAPRALIYLGIFLAGLIAGWLLAFKRRS